MRLHTPVQAGHPGRRARPWSPTTCCSTIPTAACCRTWSPACATVAPSTSWGFRRERHADRHLKPAEEMHPPVRQAPAGAGPHPGHRRALPLLAGRAQVPVPRRGFSAWRDPAGEPGGAHLDGRGSAPTPRACRTRVSAALRHELKLIAALDYAPYFLTVNAIVAFARSQGHPVPGPGLRRQLRGLLCAGRHLHRPPSATTCCSSASSRRSGASRRTSTSTSSTSGARWSCSGCFEHYGRDHAAPLLDGDPLPRPAAPSATSARRWACRRTSPRP